jgi:hypothetical protein
MNARPQRRGLQTNMPAAARQEAAEAAAAMAAINATRQTAPVAQNISEAPDKRPMTTSTIHLPVDLLDALRSAALRRASHKARADTHGRGGRPSVSEIVVELLERHREELDAMG